MAVKRRGRPRSPQTERAIVAATLTELEEVGYQSLTIESVARRAEVSRPTVYRRWPNKNALVVSALSQSVPQPTVQKTDDPLADLTVMARHFLLGIAASPAARAVLAVHAAGSHSPELRAALRENYLASRTDLLAEAVLRARRAGMIRPGITDDQVRDLLVGPAIYHWLISAEMPQPDELDELVLLGARAVAASSPLSSKASD